MTDFGNRVRAARLHAGLTQKELCRLIGISQGSLSEMENSGLSSTYTVQIAKACGVNPEWLAEEKGDMVTNIPIFGDAKNATSSDGHTTSGLELIGLNKSVPRLAWNEVLPFRSGMFKPPEDRYQVVSTTAPATPSCFLLEVNNDAMSGPGSDGVQIGALLLCDPDAEVESGHYVIAMHPQTGEPVFRRLVIDAGLWFLKARNSDYGPLQVTGQGSIVARVIKITMDIYP